MAYTLKLYDNVGDTTQQPVGSDCWFAPASLSVTPACTLGKIRLKLWNAAPGATVITCSVYGTKSSGGFLVPDSTKLIESSIVLASALGGAPGSWIDFVFTNTNTLLGSYAITLTTSRVANGTTDVFWRDLVNSGGYIANSANGVSWTTSQLHRLMYEVYTWAGKVYPTNALTRVTSIVHTFNRVLGENKLQAGMGGVLADFDLPNVTVTKAEKVDTGVPVGDTPPVVPPGTYDRKEDRLNIIKNVPPISGPTGIVPSVRQILGLDPWNPPVLHPQPGFPAPIPERMRTGELPTTTPTKIVGPAVPTQATPQAKPKPFITLTPAQTEAQKKAELELLKKKTPTNAYYVNGKLIYGGPR